MATHWDPDPNTIAIEVAILKDGRLVGMMAKDAPGPQAYPTIEKIAKGTPVFDSPDVQLGDKLKYINGIFLRGKTKDFVHETVRGIATGSHIKLGIIKGFKEKGFRMQGNGGLRVNSVRRENPLLAFNILTPDEAPIGEDDEDEGADPDDKFGPAPGDEEDSAPPPMKGRKASVYGGFGAPAGDDPDDKFGPAPGEEDDGGPSKFTAKASVYGGFGGGAEADEDEDDEFGFNFETLDIADGDEDEWG